MIGLSMNQTNPKEEYLFHPVDLDAWQEMYHIRKRYPNFHPGGLSSADDLLTTTFYPYIRTYQILVAKKPESVKNQLRLLRDGFVQLTGYNAFPRPSICVQYINFHVLSDMINQVKDRFTHGKPEVFVLWYDITDGMMEILSGLKGALEEMDRRFCLANGLRREGMALHLAGALLGRARLRARCGAGRNKYFLSFG